MPDDRTIVFDEEHVIRRIAGGEDPALPAYLRGKEWERASRGLVAMLSIIATTQFAKHYDLGRPDDAVVLSLFKGVDTWIIGVEDADAIVLQADANMPQPRCQRGGQPITRFADQAGPPVSRTR